MHATWTRSIALSFIAAVFVATSAPARADHLEEIASYSGSWEWINSEPFPPHLVAGENSQGAMIWNANGGPTGQIAYIAHYGGSWGFITAPPFVPTILRGNNASGP